MLTSRIPQITRNADQRIHLAVERAGMRIVQRAQSALYPGHGVDTGFMRGEIQWVAGPGRHEGQVVSPAEYSHFVEYGTVRMSAIPFMTPAAEQTRAEFAADIADAYR